MRGGRGKLTRAQYWSCSLRGAVAARGSSSSRSPARRPVAPRGTCACGSGCRPSEPRNRPRSWRATCASRLSGPIRGRAEGSRHHSHRPRRPTEEPEELASSARAGLRQTGRPEIDAQDWIRSSSHPGSLQQRRQRPHRPLHHHHHRQHPLPPRQRRSPPLPRSLESTTQAAGLPNRSVWKKTSLFPVSRMFLV